MSLKELLEVTELTSSDVKAEKLSSVSEEYTEGVYC